MPQNDLNRQIARQTMETVETIKRYGFSEVEMKESRAHDTSHLAEPGEVVQRSWRVRLGMTDSQR